LPDTKGFTSMRRYVLGETEETMQHLREEVLATSIADFRELAGALAGLAEVGRVVVLGSKEAIQKANAERGTFLYELKVL
jgi:Zn-dependent M16 (insulinase) family peptidase